MFGYIYPNKMELKIKDFYIYKSYYCGLCKTIKKHYGNINRFTLNYDLTFLGLLLSSIYDCNSIVKTGNCIAHPTKKSTFIYNEFMDYSAHMNTLLTYHKLLDNYIDEKSLKAFSLLSLFNKSYKKALSLYPDKNNFIKQNLGKLLLLEKNDCSSIDETSNVFGKITGEIFVFKNDEFSDILRNIGFHVGKVIYILDAYEDLPSDMENKNFNSLKKDYINDSENLKKSIERTLFITLDFLSENLKSLNLSQNNTIIENIIYSGLYLKTKDVLERKNKKDIMKI